MAAGLLAQKAVERGLEREALGEDLPRARLQGRHRVPRGRRTCHPLSRRARLRPRGLRLHDLHRKLRAASRGRCRRRSSRRSRQLRPCCREPQLRRACSHPGPRAQLPRESPPLVVAYALAGSVDVDLVNEPLGIGADGEPGLPARRSGPARRGAVGDPRRSGQPRDVRGAPTQTSTGGNERWNAIEVPTGDTYAWAPASTYVRNRPYFDGISARSRNTVERDIGRPGPRLARRLGHHGPHLAGGLDRSGRSGRRPT